MRRTRSSDERARDIHLLDADGNIACNPRDREAAHRAEVGDLNSTTDGARVTCTRCRSRA
jgi:hypothetical protein